MPSERFDFANAAGEKLAALLDKPLQSFYQDINAAARDGKKVLATLDDTRCMNYLKGYIARMDAQLRSAD